MTLFLVYLPEEIPERFKASYLRSAGTDAWKVSDDIVVFQSLETDPKKFGHEVGISDQVPGLIFKLNGASSGYWDTDFWSWMESWNVEQRTAK